MAEPIPTDIANIGLDHEKVGHGPLSQPITRRRFLLGAMTVVIAACTHRRVSPEPTSTPGPTHTPEPEPEPTPTPDPNQALHHAMEEVNRVEAQTTPEMIAKYYLALEAATVIPPNSRHIAMEIQRIYMLYIKLVPLLDFNTVDTNLSMRLIQASFVPDNFLSRAGYLGYIPVIYNSKTGQIGSSVGIDGPELYVEYMHGHHESNVVLLTEDNILQIKNAQGSDVLIRLYICENGEFISPALWSIMASERNAEGQRNRTPLPSHISPKIFETETNDVPIRYLTIGETGFNRQIMEDAIRFVHEHISLIPGFAKYLTRTPREYLANTRLMVQYEAFYHEPVRIENIFLDPSTRLFMPHFAIFEEEHKGYLFEAIVEAYLAQDINKVLQLLNQLDTVKQHCSTPTEIIQKYFATKSYSIHHSTPDNTNTHTLSTILLSYQLAEQFFSTLGWRLESNNHYSYTQYMQIVLTALAVNEYTHTFIASMLGMEEYNIMTYLVDHSGSQNVLSSLKAVEEAISSALMIYSLESVSPNPRSLQEILPY